jgi:hypothetical protein
VVITDECIVILALLLHSYAAMPGMISFEASHLTSFACSRSVRVGGKPSTIVHTARGFGSMPMRLLTAD